MGVWSEIYNSSMRKNQLRIDGEFYRPENLKAEAFVTAGDHARLGTLARDGYRVVYESTKILPSDKVTEHDARFMQAANVGRDGLSIDLENIGFVTERDWIRYPRGRVKAGEILIEVKGQAEKVTIIPPGFPARTLVSGSLFKLTVDERKIRAGYLFAYFSTKYGRLLRHRVKTNTLIGFVSKPQLYAIPVFIPKPKEVAQISAWVSQAFADKGSGQELFSSAQVHLDRDLGLDHLKFPSPVNYETNFSEAASSHRLDAQHFRPRFRQLFEHIRSMEHVCIGPAAEKSERGVQPVYVRDGPVDVVNSQHLGKQHLNYEGFEKTSELEFCRHPEAHIRYGDVLIYTTGAYIGRTNVFLRETPALASNHVHILRLKGDLDPAYVALVLSSVVGSFQTEKYARGSTQAELYPSDIAKFILPIIAQDKQRQIGDLVRRSLEAQDKSRCLLTQAKRRVEELIEEAIEK